MVRKIGSNTPSIDAPQLYDVSGQMMQKMGQDVQGAFSASMQAFNGLNAAYDANARRQMSYLAQQEEAKALQAQASQQQGRGGGMLEGIGKLTEGIMGGLAAKQEIEAKQEAFALERLDKERQFQLEQDRLQYQMFTGEREFETEQIEAQQKQELEKDKQLISEISGGLAAELEGMMISMSAEEGVAYTVSRVTQTKEQYKELFAANPMMESQFNTELSKIQQNLYRHYGNTYRGEMDMQRLVAVETINQKVNLTFADRYAELQYSAGLMSAEQAQASFSEIISQGVALAQNDPAFATAVKQRPGLWLNFMKNLYGQAGDMYKEFANKNAEINATVQKVDQVNAIMGQIGEVNDPQVFAMLQHEFARLGLDYSDPSKWGTSYNSTIKRQAESMELTEKLSAAAVARDPMYGVDTPEQRIVTNVSKAQMLYNAYNNKEGWDTSSANSYFDAEIRSAQESGDIDKEKFFLTQKNFFKEFDVANKQYQQGKKDILKAQQDYAKASRPDPNTTIVKDPVTGSAIRVEVSGLEPAQKATPQEIKMYNDRLKDLYLQQSTLEQQWLGRGFNLANPSDRAALDNMQAGAAPHVQKLNERLMQQGVAVYPEEKARNLPQPPPRQYAPQNQSSVPPVNFSGGRVPNATVVQGQTGSLPFASSGVPLANAVPFQGGVAQAPNIGFVPFKGGTVKVVSKPDSKGLALQSTDPRVATMMGGKVVYAGNTQTMGKVVVVQTADGISEVYTNLDRINVLPDSNVKPGVAVGTAAGTMEIQVWKTNSPVKALRMEIPRNEINPVVYLQGISGYVKEPAGLGVIDITRDKPRPVGGENSNIFAGDGYSIYGTLLIDKKTGRQRELTKAEFTSIYPQGMHDARKAAQQNNAANNSYLAQPYNPTVQLGGNALFSKAGQAQAVGGTDMLSFGKNLQSQGYQVLGYSPLGRNNRLGKAIKSDHARDMAMDINFDGKGKPEAPQLRALYNTLRNNAEALGISQMIFEGKQYKNGQDLPWTKADHNDHLHIAFKSTKFKQAMVGSLSQNNTAPGRVMGSVSAQRKDTFANMNSPELQGNKAALTNLQAFGDMIAYSEGHGRPTQYNTPFGWKGTLDTSKGHPGGKAMGRYQFLASTWKDIWGGKNPPMSPENQDIGFVKLLKRAGAYEDVLAGKFTVAFKKVANTWVSVKGASYAVGARQGVFEPKELADKTQQLAGQYTKDNAPAPPPRTNVTNAPLHQVNAPRTTPSAYKSTPTSNYGYTALAKKPYVARVIHQASIQSGIPGQWLADRLYKETKGFTTNLDKLTVPQIIRGGRVLADDVPQRRTPVARPEDRDVLPNRTPVNSPGTNRQYTTRKKKKQWHFKKRSNCATCNAMPSIIPHFIYVE